MDDTVNIKKIETLSKEKYTLKKVTFERASKDRSTEEQSKEVYDMGDAVTVLLYNSQQKTVILTKQFRLPSYLNGNKTGMLIEACAGKLENETPEECAKREIEEETGYTVPAVKKKLQMLFAKLIRTTFCF